MIQFKIGVPKTSKSIVLSYARSAGFGVTFE